MFLIILWNIVSARRHGNTAPVHYQRCRDPTPWRDSRCDRLLSEAWSPGRRTAESHSSRAVSVPWGKTATAASATGPRVTIGATASAPQSSTPCSAPPTSRYGAATRRYWTVRAACGKIQAAIVPYKFISAECPWRWINRKQKEQYLNLVPKEPFASESINIFHDIHAEVIRPLLIDNSV